MSELKATTAYDVYWKANSVGEGTGILVYLKSEADKVIAEIEERLNNSRNARKYWRKEYLIAYKECCFQKYKRCLAMAKWCLFWANYWHCCEPNDLGAFIARERFYRKWHKRWLELAEKFKTKNEVNNG